MCRMYTMMARGRAWPAVAPHLWSSSPWRISLQPRTEQYRLQSSQVSSCIRTQVSQGGLAGVSQQIFFKLPRPDLGRHFGTTVFASTLLEIWEPKCMARLHLVTPVRVNLCKVDLRQRYLDCSMHKWNHNGSQSTALEHLMFHRKDWKEGCRKLKAKQAFPIPDHGAQVVSGEDYRLPQSESCASSFNVPH